MSRFEMIGRVSRTALLLDLDGTLTDSGPGIYASVRHALERLGHPGIDEPRLRAFVGPPLQDSFAALGLDPEVAVATYREYFNDRGIRELTVYPGIPELLNTLAGQGVALVVATSKPEVLALSILAATGLDTHIAHTCGPGLDGSNRHKRDSVARALDLLGITDTSTAVMLGDRVHDVEGAAACGVDTIGALWGYGEPGELDGAWARAAAPEDVVALLEAR